MIFLKKKYFRFLFDYSAFLAINSSILSFFDVISIVTKGKVSEGAFDIVNNFTWCNI